MRLLNCRGGVPPLLIFTATADRPFCPLLLDDVYPGMQAVDVERTVQAALQASSLRTIVFPKPGSYALCVAD